MSTVPWKPFLVSASGSTVGIEFIKEVSSHPGVYGVILGHAALFRDHMHQIEESMDRVGLALYLRPHELQKSMAAKYAGVCERRRVTGLVVSCLEDPRAIEALSGAIKQPVGLLLSTSPASARAPLSCDPNPAEAFRRISSRFFFDGCVFEDGQDFPLKPLKQPGGLPSVRAIGNVHNAVEAQHAFGRGATHIVMKPPLFGSISYWLDHLWRLIEPLNPAA